MLPFEPLLGTVEAGALLRLHPKTVQKLARQGALPCIRMGKYWRFRASSLDAWLAYRLNLEIPVTARGLKERSF